MKVESKRGRISGSSNRAKRGRNAEGKGGRSTKLANTQKYQRGAKVLGPSQLLQKVYKGLCKDSGTITCTGQKGAEIEVGKGAKRSV